uniref:Uncharacterized protein n=1 Tax=Manihot esculenta TaxID=3983 RepID=A0A2C9UZR7_MANES
MQEKLFSMLRDVLRNKPNVDVVKLQKSGGVVSRSSKARQKARSYRIRTVASTSTPTIASAVKDDRDSNNAFNVDTDGSFNGEGKREKGNYMKLRKREKGNYMKLRKREKGKTAGTATMPSTSTPTVASTVKERGKRGIT